MRMDGTFEVMRIILFFALFLSSTALQAIALTPGQEAVERDNDNTSINLTISELLHDGRVIVLSDGSKWEIDKRDWNISGGWIGPAEIKITRGRGKKFPYKLYNKWTNNFVRAKKASLSN